MPSEPVAPEDGGPAAARGPVGLCLGCNYPLRGLSEPRCPECGRGFDPDDPKTMNMGGPIGRLGRLLARPIGWPLVLLALLATVGVLYQSRPPVGGWLFSRIDLTYYRAYARLPWKPQAGTLRDTVYTYALTLWMLVAVVWVPRTVARWSTIRLHRIPKPQRGRQGDRQLLMVLLLALTLGAVGYGWPYRVARVWAEVPKGAVTLTPVPRGLVSRTGRLRIRRVILQPTPAPCPLPLNEAERTAVLRAAVVQLGSPDLRREGLERLIALEPGKTREALVLAAPREKDPPLLALELRLLGLCGGEGPADRSVEVLTPFLDDPSPALRAAAADGLGEHFGPAYPVMMDTGPWISPGSRATTADGNIPLAPLISAYHGSPPTAPVTTRASAAEQGMPPQLRSALEKMMLQGKDAEEREAAARALLPWPPAGYQLRLAEWGVWVTGADGPAGSPGRRLVSAQLDTIPPFVHQTGNSSDEFETRILRPIFTFKPVIHLTVDRPLAVDLEVILHRGRPWYAYPRPDDFALELGDPLTPDPTVDAKGNWHGDSTFPTLDVAAKVRKVAPLDDLREGYPWLTPAHRMYGSAGTGGTADVGDLISLGLRWQSLIVSPRKLDWMTPPQVGSGGGSGAGGGKYDWWEKLRDVPCAWVSSRGEAERFVYYDGPMRLNSPVAVEVEGQPNAGDPPAALRLQRDPLWPEPPGLPPEGGSQSGSAPSVPSPWRFVEQGATGLETEDVGRRASAGAVDWSSLQTAAGLGGRGRRGLFLRVHGGHVTGRAVSMRAPTKWEDGRAIYEPKRVPLDSAEPVDGPAVEARLRSMLIDGGLAPSEAEALLSTWRQPFFEKEGSRFLLLLSDLDYATMCPLSVRPPPTQIARVGIVLTEF